MISRVYLFGAALVLLNCPFLKAAALNSDTSPQAERSIQVMNVPGGAPVVTNTIPASRAVLRSLPTIEIFFSDDVTGVDAADLLLNGVPGTNVTAFSPNQYVFEFAEPAPGELAVTWAAGHGIHAADSEANVFAGDSWSYTYDPTLPGNAVVISEFMADNDRTLNDENGDSSDWIEIWNSGDDPVDLTGWFLSNDPNTPAKWRFPSVTLDSRSYLVVFASEKDRTDPAGKLHTNFKLPNGGGSVVLSDPAIKAVSALDYPAQREDVSYGREPGSESIVGFFTKPTPGAVNATGGPGFAPTVHFSRRGGTFRDRIEVVLATDAPNAKIYYSTRNGKNLPTESSNLYTGPIVITNTTHLRARAFVPGLLPGEPHSESYIALAPTALSVNSDLPIVILHNYGAGNIPATGEQFVMMQLFEPKNGVASLTNAPDLSERARFRRRGSSTESYPKWSFALEAWDEFNNDKKIEVLGMPEESDWNFYAPNNFEPVLIHNPFMYQLSRDIGRYASRTRFVEVYLNYRGGSVGTTNYFGIYVMMEKIKRGADRVDVDKLEPQHLKEPEVTGGYMLKIDRPDPGDASFSAGGFSEMNYVDPKGPVIRTPARDPQEQYILSYLRQLGNVLNNPTLARDPVNGYAKYLDVPASIDHHILNVLAFNVDALRLSTYLYKPRNGKLAWGPIWDFDRALGSRDGRDANPRTWGNTGGSSFFQFPVWTRLFADPNFWQKWIDRWEELRRDQFSTTNINRLIDHFTGQVRNAQVREYARWRGSAPVRGSYENEINLMKKYLKDRTEYIDAQLVRPPVLDSPGKGPSIVRPGSLIELTATNTIYYTLDGSDPRLSGGGISSNALVYSGPIVLHGNARLMARAHKPGHTGGPSTAARSPWSGLVATTYVVEAPKLALTEIMFNPAPPPAGSTNAAQDFEFLEFTNIGVTPLQLEGFTLQKGVEFTFPAGVLAPGDRIVVVKNRAAFLARYGVDIPIAGEFSGSLENTEDRIVLTGPLQEPILDFTYHESWYPLADGLGFSLVLRDENSSFVSYSTPGAWRASAKVNGSPGAIDPQPPSFPPVYVNEVLARPSGTQHDKVELYNASAEPAAIGEWFLSDDFSEPKKFRIPPGTIIQPNSFLVFEENQFNAGNTAFAFSATGDDIYLFSADASGELTGYIHGFEFGASANRTSFGRFLSTDGREHFVPQSAQSFGAGNAPPSIGPLILSEIMFEPSPTGIYDNTLDEYIEWYNPTAQPVLLRDPSALSNAWQLSGGVQFDFPEPVAIPAGGYALLVSFDPLLEPERTANFADAFQVPASVPILGPFDGNLSNQGEPLILFRPESSLANGSGEPALVLVDQVEYGIQSPWPSGATGTGKSLQRIVTRFGNDPFSWIAASPTAGRALAEADPDPDRDGLPSDWEVAHDLNPNDATGDNGGAGDPDNDGVHNLQEYLAGTDPRNFGSVLRLSASFQGGERRFLFEAVPGRSYSVLYKTRLEEPWTRLADFAASENATTRIVVDPTADSARFYQVVTPRQ